MDQIVENLTEHIFNNNIGEFTNIINDIKSLSENERITILTELVDGDTLLHYASAARRSIYMKTLLEILDNKSIGFKKFINRRTSDEEKETAIHVALTHVVPRRTRFNNIVYLLKHRADANLRNAEGVTPFIMASVGEFPNGVQIMNILQKGGADINSKFNGNSALHLTCHRVFYDQIMMLSKMDNIVINSKNNDGNTPLHLLVSSNYGTAKNRRRLTEALIYKGAKFNIRNNQGKNAYNVARDKSVREYIEKLLEPKTEKLSRKIRESFYVPNDFNPGFIRARNDWNKKRKRRKSENENKAKKSKASFGTKRKAKKVGVKLSYVRKGKRVYKSEKTLKKQIKNHLKKRK